MTDKEFCSLSLDDNFNDLTYLDEYIEDEIFEWYSIEGAERIKELSRQVRTFLNYRTSMIYLRFSRSQKCDNVKKREIILQKERALNEATSHLLVKLKDIGVYNGNLINEKIQDLFEKIRHLPNNIEIDRLKSIKLTSKNIWELIHILSELEIHHHPRLFNRIMNISCIICEIQSVMFYHFSDFYYELKSNYLLLDEEMSDLLNINSINEPPSIKNKKKVRVLK